MPQRFTGKSVLVTGGGSGIGRGAALAFAREGATVTVAGRNEENLAQTVKLIEAEGGRADAVTADVTDSADVARLVETTVARHGGLDIAFNNAGVTVLGTVVDIEEADWARTLETNVTGIWLSLRHEVAYMKENGGGVIVNMASNAGTEITMPQLGAYGATKAAVSALTRAAARDHIGDGIRINAISPGPVRTDLLRLPGDSDADVDARFDGLVPLGRIGEVEEAAAAVLWLASDEASYAVGHRLVLDGGVTA